MNKISIGLIVLTCAALLSCAIPTVSNNGDSTTTTTVAGEVIQKSIKVNDKNGVFLGYSTSSTSFDIVLMTNVTAPHYSVKLAWDGTPYTSSVYFTGQNGTLIPVVQWYTVYRRPYGYTGFFSPGHSKWYRLKTLVGGIPQQNAAITTYATSWDGTSWDNTTPSTPITTAEYYELEEVTAAAIGLPATIVGPLSLTFE